MAVHCSVPASDNGRGTQMPYIKDLMQQRSIPDEPRQAHPEDSLMLERIMDVFGGKMMCKHEASDFIEWLLLLNMKDGSPPPAQAPRTKYARSYAPRPSQRQRWSGMGSVPSTRSPKDIALEVVAVARQLAAQPGVKERMRLVGQLSALEAELLR